VCAIDVSGVGMHRKMLAIRQQASGSIEPLQYSKKYETDSSRGVSHIIVQYTQ
jgi:hypothetical protein